jgi:hypothetical protein
VIITKDNSIWILANGVGICAFAILNLQALVIESGDEGGPDPIGAFAFCFTYEVPLMVVFLVVNFAWLLVLLRNRKVHNRNPIFAWLLSGVAWIVTMTCCRTGWGTILLFADMLYEKLFGTLRLW